MASTDYHVFIYGLYDPRDGLCHYIGQTKNPGRRRGAHFGITASTPISAWVMQVRASGDEPEFRILATVESAQEADETEVRMIAEGFAAGWPLLNRRGAPETKLSLTERREAEYRAFVEAVRARDRARAVERAHRESPEGEQERRLQVLARVHARAIEIALLPEGDA